MDQGEQEELTENSKDLIDTILNDPAVARLYWALSKLDSETSKSLQRSIGIGKLLPYAAVLDFYGRRLCISGGRVVVPGGVAAESAWKDLVGAGPGSPAAFVERLVAKDKGWLAAYFDVLSRASANQQAYFTQGHRLRLFYEGLRAPDTSFKATRGTFRPAPALLLLATRLQFASSGEPLIPGSLEVWKDILLDGHNSNVVRKSTKRSAGLTGPDDLVQLLFTLSRAVTDSGPLQIYMTISELDSRRAPGHGLAPTTVRLLASKFEEFSDQYRIFSEFPELSDESITLFLDAVQRLNRCADVLYVGTHSVSFRQMLESGRFWPGRGEISNRAPERLLAASSQTLHHQFDRLPRCLTRSILPGRTFGAATGEARVSQDEIIELLAGPSTDDSGRNEDARGACLAESAPY